jgi:hypothetical protein
LNRGRGAALGTESIERFDGVTAVAANHCSSPERELNSTAMKQRKAAKHNRKIELWEALAFGLKTVVSFTPGL